MFRQGHTPHDGRGAFRPQSGKPPRQGWVPGPLRMAVRWRWALWLAVGGWLISGSGCDTRPSRKQFDRDSLSEYASLPGLRASHNEQLARELARIESQQGTPTQLMKHNPKAVQDPLSIADGAVAQQAKKATAALQRRLTAQQHEWLTNRLRQQFPSGSLTMGPIALRGNVRLVQQYQTERLAIREMLRQPGFDFYVAFEHGLLADLTFVDTVHLYAQLEGLEAIRLTFADRPDDAVEPVSYMLHVAQRLGEKKHPVLRITASQIREDALRVVEVIVQHHQSTRSTQQRILTLIDDQLAFWPPDRDAWIGDRAIGLHTYELVRDGMLLSLLSWQEVQSLEANRELRSYLEALTSSADDDQVFYLEAMHDIIESCDHPHFQRNSVLQDLDRRLNELSNTPQYPLLAADFFLNSIPPGSRMQARDRALCEIWSLALSKATGQVPPPYDTNPIDGQSYSIQDGEKTIEALHTPWRSGHETLSIPKR